MLAIYAIEFCRKEIEMRRRVELRREMAISPSEAKQKS